MQRSEDLTLERTSECVVCLEPIHRSAIGSCSHHFCASCLLECCRLTPRCPRCQTEIKAVWLDPEFDAVLKLARNADHRGRGWRSSATQKSAEVESAAADATLAPFVRVLRLPLQKRFPGQMSGAGITLKTCIGRPGVVCAGLDELDMAHKCGFSVGDVIVNMNGMPCYNHKQTIALINRLAKTATASEDAEITCLVIPGVGLNAPVRVTDEPWAADDALPDDELDYNLRRRDGEAEAECVIS